MPSKSKSIREWNIDIDQFLNPFIPPPPRNYLPKSILHFLGYRPIPSQSPRRRQYQWDDPPQPQPQQPPPPPLGNIFITTWAFLGTLASLSLVYILCRSVPLFQNLEREGVDIPVILGSFGAAAILEFHTIDSPLAQPRNALLGQLLACTIGISLSKSLPTSPSPSPSTTTTTTALTGVLSTTLSLSLMSLTSTVHPPAGATALLAVTDPSIRAMGWTLIPFVMLSCVGMLIVACLLNNIQRRFPLYWWTPAPAEEVGCWWRGLFRSGGGNGETKDDDEEKGCVDGDSIDHHFGDEDEDDDEDVEGREDFGRRVTVSKRGVVMPKNVYLRPEERVLLDKLVKRL